jgi:hypothetical protein
MCKHLVHRFAAVVSLLGVTAAAQADVYIRVPFVTIHVGNSGPVVVNPPSTPPLIIGQPIDVPPVGTQPRVVQERPPAVVVTRPPTLDEFAASFKPAPGKYEVVIQHPVTCEPVKVCFCLPEGCPKKVHVYRREIDFDYGRTEVSIRFIRDGRVRVSE